MDTLDKNLNFYPYVYMIGKLLANYQCDSPGADFK